MTKEQPWTLGRLLTWTTEYLTEHGSESPRLEAEVLLAFVRGCQRIELYTAFEETAPEELRTKFREVVQKRAAGTPVAYLVGYREFYSLNFDVTPDVLIPRPETELIVVSLLDAVKERAKQKQPWRIIDLGTGSGILAICAAKYLKNKAVTAIDISRDALKVAYKNGLEHEVQEEITFIVSDLFDAVPAEQQFDFVISNPPYISSAEMKELPADVQQYEPHVALHGGDTGTEIIARMLGQLNTRLAPGGETWIEISPMIAEAVERLVLTHSKFELLPTIKDLSGYARIIHFRNPSS